MDNHAILSPINNTILLFKKNQIHSISDMNTTIKQKKRFKRAIQSALSLMLMLLGLIAYYLDPDSLNQNMKRYHVELASLQIWKTVKKHGREYMKKKEKL